MATTSQREATIERWCRCGTEWGAKADVRWCPHCDGGEGCTAYPMIPATAKDGQGETVLTGLGGIGGACTKCEVSRRICCTCGQPAGSYVAALECTKKDIEERGYE
ncbi:hypothetical protein EDD28_0025 [Salana multivorans]|uniref:Uncharacterized protein n=1 Tax=Salana multivorans TaxID=120377 RepID=A0A3N2D6V1_9MICO|nr:hypothetical protein [Salana multivorans]ROR93074.1 hypothetical protein EDD28_2479 [Salana multivorans]ROR95472.1 hypothetical protein EDD28_0025 [Salana multivorans]